MFCQLSSLYVRIAQRWEKGAFNYQMETSLLHPIYLPLYPSPDVPFFLHVLSPIILYLLFTSHWQSIGHHLYRMTRKKVVFIGRYDAIYWLVFLGLVV